MAKLVPTRTIARAQRTKQLKRLSRKDLEQSFKDQYGDRPMPMMEPVELLGKDEIIEMILFAEKLDERS